MTRLTMKLRAIGLIRPNDAVTLLRREHAAIRRLVKAMPSVLGRFISRDDLLAWLDRRTKEPP